MKSTRQTAPPRRVLWTGGFDSTFRVAYSLLVEKVDVQPIYVIDTSRLSTMQELRTIGKMRKALQGRSKRARLLPTEVHIREDYRVPHELQKAFDSIKSRAHIGAQYLWLAAVAESQGWNGVELSMERYPGGPSDLQRSVFVDRTDGTLRAGEATRLFHYWSFPVLHLTKQEMMSIAEKHGFGDILRMRWFCHRPVGDLACGWCRPCEIAHRDGMAGGIRFVPVPLRWLTRALLSAQRLVRRLAVGEVR